MHKNLFYNKFIICLYMFRALRARHQVVKIVLYSIWYRHTETSEWYKITKIQFYKYEHIVVKFMYDFFGCDYCILLTINMLWHVEVTFIQLLNLLKVSMSIYVYVRWVYLVIKSYNPLTPNDLYMSRTTLLTSKRFILYIYSTNVGTKYFKHALYSPFFSLQNAVCFIMLTCLVPVL